jgi:hypothetical protein
MRDNGTTTYPGCDVELRNETNDVEGQTDVTSPHTGKGSERKLFHMMALMDPSLSKANMCKADAAPGEEAGNTGERKEPVEELVAHRRSAVDVGEQRKAQLKGDSGERTALLVHIGQDLGSHSSLSERLEGPGGTEGGGVCDTDDCKGDDSIENTGETFDAGVLNGNDESVRINTLVLLNPEVTLTARIWC